MCKHMRDAEIDERFSYASETFHLQSKNFTTLTRQMKREIDVLKKKKGFDCRLEW
jgi:hypothetical protein